MMVCMTLKECFHGLWDSDRVSSWSVRLSESVFMGFKTLLGRQKALMKFSWEAEDVADIFWEAKKR